MSSLVFKGKTGSICSRVIFFSSRWTSREADGLFERSANAINIYSLHVDVVRLSTRVPDIYIYRCSLFTNCNEFSSFLIHSSVASVKALTLHSKQVYSSGGQCFE